jgi:hypothetical protein
MMRQCLPLLLGALLAAPAGAQMTVRLTAGVTMGTPLVEDVLGGPVSLGTGLPPTIALSVTHPIGAKYRAMVEARAGRGPRQVDDDGTSDDLGTLTTVGIMALVDGPVAGAVRWELGAGVMSYRPADRDGVFSQGGPSPWIIGGGLTWTRPIGASLDLLAAARYDFHQFRTRQLESRGYTQFQTVHRLGLGIGIERRF